MEREQERKRLLDLRENKEGGAASDRVNDERLFMASGDERKKKRMGIEIRTWG